MAAVIAGAALTVPFRQLWDPDEARYAEVTREMLESGQMLVPFLYGGTYPHKPPLYFWAQAALRSMGASWTVAAVAPPLLAMLATLLLLPRFAALLGLGTRVGYLASALLASTPLASGMALTGRMDMLLVAFHTGALFLLARLLGLGGEAPPGRAVHLAFWVCIALGALTKGPVALALPLLVAVSMWAMARPAVTLRPVLAGAGPLVFLAIVLAWLVPAGLAGGPEYIADLLIRQTVDRVTASSFAHPEPIYFHLVTYPLTGLPWSPIVILAVVAALRRRERLAGQFLAVGVVTLVALFSLVSGKLVIYLLPMFPVAALLAADYLDRHARGSRVSLIVGSTAAVGLGVVLVSAPLWRPEVAGGAGVAILAGVSLVLAGAIAVTVSFRSRGPTAAGIAALVAAGLTVVVIVLPLSVRLFDSRAGSGRIARAIEELEPGRDHGFVFREDYPGLWLYAERRFEVLTTPSGLSQALRRCRWVLIRERHLRAVPEDVRDLIAETRSFKHRGRTVLLVHGGDPQCPGRAEPEASASQPAIREP
jgi:4-amino-4-deoxy-L-arabinose transferase-like glycosyltransferase